MSIFDKKNFAKLGLYAVGITASALLMSGSASAVRLPNSAFSTSNLKVFNHRGEEVLDGGTMSCNMDLTFDFDYTIASEQTLHAGDTLEANILGPAASDHIPLGVRSTAPVEIKNQEGTTIATWEFTSSRLKFVIKEGGDGLNSFSGKINTGKNLNTSTCSTKEINEVLKVDWTSGTGPQDQITVRIPAGTFPAIAQHYAVGNLTTSRFSTTAYTPTQTINSIYKSKGKTALSSDEKIEDLWIETKGGKSFDSYEVKVNARVTTPADSVGDVANMEGGVSYNGQNVAISACGQGSYPCHMKVDANDGESKEDFIQRLRTAQGDEAIIPYGRHGDSVIVYFGDIPSTNDDVTYQNALQNEGYESFEARASACLSKPLWHTVDEAVGTGNVYGGKIVYFGANAIMNYNEPLTVSGQKVTATIDWNYKDGSGNIQQESIPVERAVSIGSSGEVVQKQTASLQLIDADSKAPIAGAEFKLQKQDGSNWVDVQDASRTTDNEGKLQVISLSDGTYRWVQTGYAADYYVQGDTPYYENTELNNRISEFAVNGDNGYNAVATNARKSYTITFKGGDYAAADFTDIVKTQLYGDNTIIPSTSEIKGATGWTFGGWDTEPAEKVTGDATYTAVWNQEMTTISGQIEWLDANNDDRIRPSEVYVSAVMDGHTLDRSTVADANGLFTIRQLPKYTGMGVLIDYSVFVNVSGYTTQVVKNDNGTLTVKLTHGPLTSIKINKLWDDENDEAMRPESVTFYLMMDGRHAGKTATLGKGETSVVIEDVAKFADLSGNGVLADYSIYEESDGFYDFSVIKDSAYEFTVTNKLQSPTPTNYEMTVNTSAQGGALDDGRTANIVLTPVSDGAPMPSDATDGKKTVPVGDGDSVNLGNITFDEAGSYQYEIALETNPATIGDESGNNSYTAVVEVVRNKDTNELEIASEKYYDSEGNEVDPSEIGFNIIPLAPQETTENVAIQLPVDGSLDEGAIEATITGKDGAPMPSDSEDGKKTSFVNPDGSLNIGDITFTEKGEYEYDIKLDSDEYDIDLNEFTVVVKVELDEQTNTLYIADAVAYDKEGNEISLEDLNLGIRKRNAGNPDTAAVNNAPIFVLFGALAAGLGSAFYVTRRR